MEVGILAATVALVLVTAGLVYATWKLAESTRSLERIAFVEHEARKALFRVHLDEWWVERRNIGGERGTMKFMMIRFYVTNSGWMPGAINQVRLRETGDARSAAICTDYPPAKPAEFDVMIPSGGHRQFVYQSAYDSAWNGKTLDLEVEPVIGEQIGGVSFGPIREKDDRHLRPG